jgi:hypothetical protein
VLRHGLVLDAFSRDKPLSPTRFASGLCVGRILKSLNRFIVYTVNWQLFHGRRRSGTRHHLGDQVETRDSPCLRPIIHTSGWKPVSSQLNSNYTNHQVFFVTLCASVCPACVVVERPPHMPVETEQSGISLIVKRKTAQIIS